MLRHVFPYLPSELHCQPCQGLGNAIAMGSNGTTRGFTSGKSLDAGIVATIERWFNANSDIDPNLQFTQSRRCRLTLAPP